PITRARNPLQEQTLAPRLIDLRCDRLDQYAGETNLRHVRPAHAIEQRLARLDGYLSTVAASVLSCRCARGDLSQTDENWRSLAHLIAGDESEFAGRPLSGRGDGKRWAAEPADGFCW